MEKQTPLTLAAVIGAVFLLAGCSSEPSDDDVASAMKAVFDAANAQVARFNNPLVSAMKVDFIAARKISCAPVEGAKEKFNCDVEVETKAPTGGSQKVTKTVPFVKDGDSWKAVI
ncbi:hypothetical protein J4G53_24630 [Serratia ureilytica]|uniref:hypothetical protein n=1 Tax=Serratia ureilytica TaxID=300181 RepID=UPI001AA114FD|nr:hypothetical protein [Serratia ureilytica]MBO1811423.1 hypothetical protein [Serratia ureilytica]